MLLYKSVLFLTVVSVLTLEYLCIDLSTGVFILSQLSDGVALSNKVWILLSVLSMQ